MGSSRCRVRCRYSWFESDEGLANSVALDDRNLRLAGGCRRAGAATHADGQLQIEVVDAETHAPIAARMHLKNAHGKAIKLKGTG